MTKGSNVAAFIQVGVILLTRAVQRVTTTLTAHNNLNEVDPVSPPTFRRRCHGVYVRTMGVVPICPLVSDEAEK